MSLPPTSTKCAHTASESSSANPFPVVSPVPVCRPTGWLVARSLVTRGVCTTGISISSFLPIRCGRPMNSRLSSSRSSHRPRSNVSLGAPPTLLSSALEDRRRRRQRRRTNRSPLFGYIVDVVVVIRPLSDSLSFAVLAAELARLQNLRFGGPTGTLVPPPLRGDDE